MGRRKNLIIVFCLIIFIWPLMVRSASTQSWKAVLAQIQARDYQKAIYGLKKLLASNPEPIWQKRALFLLAYTYRQAGKDREAEDYFSRARKGYEQMRDYIELELSEIWLAQGKPRKAYESIKTFGDKYPKSPLLYDAQLLEAHTLKEIGDYAQAIRKYQAVIEGEGLRNRKKEAEAIFGWAESLTKTGQSSEAWELYRKVYFNYPEQALADTSWRQMNILDKHKVLTLTKKSLDLYLKRAEKLIELGHYTLALRDYETVISIQPLQEYLEKALLQQAFCLNKLRERIKAKVLLEEFIDKYRDNRYITEGLYHLAKLYWNTNDHYKSERVIQRLIKTYPTDPWTEKGMLVLGLMKEEEGRWTLARMVYEDMAKQFPQGELLPEVYWRWGWAEYTMGDYTQAARVFEDLIHLPNGEKHIDKAIYWHARVLERVGQKEEAQGYYEELARNYPYSYYGIKGGERWLGSQHHKKKLGPPKDNNTSLIPKDIAWSAEQSYYLERIRELSPLALYVEMQHEVKYLMKVLPPDISYQYHLAKFFYQNGFYYEAIKILGRILLATQAQDRSGLPRELWELLYPLAYWDQVNHHAKQNHQDPYLIMAIIRQESAFQSGAISSAGACGLMQILPSTGKFIFQSLGKDGFERQYLFDPGLNISSGIWYFDYLKDKFNKNLVLSLAGYNAGPEKVKEWVKLYGMHDPEEFIENIPYRETQDYIKNVLRNRFFYQKIYGAKRKIIDGG